MSHREGELSCPTKDFPSNDQIIDEVIESCKNLKVENKLNESGEPLNEANACSNGDCDGDSDKETELNIDEDYIDDTVLKDLELSLSPEQININKTTAIELKNKGNSSFKEQKYDDAKKTYTEALKICPFSCSEERAILFSNRAACKVAQELKKEAIADCDRAIGLNPNYVRALSRRAKLYENTEKLDEALEDYKKILELDPGNSEARSACMRLPEEINERNEKLKEQMLSSLKELGNKILKPFGLSTNNFQVQKDPNSGGYSINFNQNPK